MKRRTFLSFLGLLPMAAFAGNFWNFFKKKPPMTIIKAREAIDFQWPVQEPFLFCVHHYDRYPAGNKNFGLDVKHFQGRAMGSDFVVKDGFRIYHGAEIPGFPVHPHRGFETITIVRKGYVDHADSLGAAGRYGEGDVQWMTAGGGVRHSEMFPLLHQDKENTLELFQIWLNLPKKNKMVPADFKMLWSHTIPKIQEKNAEVSLICGEYHGKTYRQAPTNSWASDPTNEVTILLVKLEKGGTFEFGASKSGTNRSLYAFEGRGPTVNGEKLTGKEALFVDSSQKLSITTDDSAEFLFLEAKPIGEPVYQHGPFVMNNKQEILEAIHDYQRTEFGGWKWNRSDMIHGSRIERFAKYPDGRVEKPS